MCQPNWPKDEVTSETAEMQREYLPMVVPWTHDKLGLADC